MIIINLVILIIVIVVIAVICINMTKSTILIFENLVDNNERNNNEIMFEIATYTITTYIKIALMNIIIYYTRIQTNDLWMMFI
jgi:hypothetical protein